MSGARATSAARAGRMSRKPAARNGVRLEARDCSDKGIVSEAKTMGEVASKYGDDISSMA